MNLPPVDIASLSEREICSKIITPALQDAGWDLQTQIREERTLADGRIEVRGSRSRRRKEKRADYVLEMKPNIPVAIIEAKRSKYSLGHGMPQALAYSEMQQVPFVFSSNGTGFLFHDKTATDGPRERELSLGDFPSPAELWDRYCNWRGIDEKARPVVIYGYFTVYRAITIMDFKKATEVFADPDFDGDPVQVYEPSVNEPPVPDEEASDIDDIESMEVLKVQPLSGFGTPMEIVRMFGTKQDYLRALKDLEAELYGEVS